MAMQGFMSAWMLLCLALLPGIAAAQTTLRTVLQSGAPVKYDPQQAARPGLCLELLRAVEALDPGLRFSGLNLQAPLRRIERMLEGGEIDVFFCLLDTPQRRRLADYLPVPLYTVRHWVVQRSEDARSISGYAELREAGQRKPVLVAQGSVLAQSLQAAGVPFSDVARSDVEALRMLALGRSDALYGQDMTLRPLLQGQGEGARFRVASGDFKVENHYAVVGRHLPEATASRLLRALQQLERSGKLAELQQKYR